MGPGSYTGLRIGVSAAKGFCYALDKPLISIPTLQSMALSAMHGLSNIKNDGKEFLFCPMIDARRMEVYTALYNSRNEEVMETEAMIVDGDSFTEKLQSYQIYYFGDGAEKCRHILDPKGMIYLQGITPSSKSMAYLSAQKFRNKQFEDVAYFEPYYLKDFIAGKPRVKGLE
jgi:tRNA threonylcarbamoyladenosine biosynthesis protein TsaB